MTKNTKLAEDYRIYEYLNPKTNDKLSDFNEYKISKIIGLIDCFYLELRDELGLDSRITFGIEIEFEYAMKERITENLKHLKSSYSRLKDDMSLNNGGEINSPIMLDKNKTWKKLDEICNILSQYAIIDSHSGGHIHFGSQILGNDMNVWLNFIKLWSVYENIIYRFSYGEFLNARSDIEEYAAPVASEFWECYQYFKYRDETLEYLLFLLSCNRNQAVNFINVKKNFPNLKMYGNTIEIRCPNGSLNSIIWQNNINFFAKLLKYSNSENFDNEIINYRHKISKNNSELSCYSNIYIDQALELCDLIFTNNLDKIYFLKQYIKSFAIDNNFINGPVLTKKLK